MKLESTKFNRSNSKLNHEKHTSCFSLYSEKSESKSLKTQVHSDPKKRHSLLNTLTPFTQNPKPLVRVSTINFDSRKLEESKAKELERKLKERLNKFESGSSSWNSEIEILDSVFFELSSYFNKFSSVLMSLRKHYEESFLKYSSMFLHQKLEKVKKKNLELVGKINSLSKIHQDLLNENERLRKSQDEYERLFQNKPEVLINYNNIIDQMIGQCKVIDGLKKENKSLRKGEVANAKMINELKLQLKHQGSLSFLEIPE
jgi:hypothetical protein